MPSCVEFVTVLACLSFQSSAWRVSTSSRSSDDNKKMASGALSAFLLAIPVTRERPNTVKPSDSTSTRDAHVRPQTVRPLDSIFSPSSGDRVVSKQPWINKLLDDSITVKIPPEFITTDSIVDPLAREKANEERLSANQYKLNVGFAIDCLNSDMPNILRAHPNWEIYTEDLELNLEGADPVAFRLLGSVAGLGKTKVKGLQANHRALNRLQRFRSFWVQHDEIRIKNRASLELGRSADGDDIVEVRWNAKLVMKPDIDLIPGWASTSIKFFQGHLPHVFGHPDQATNHREFIIDGVSRFFFNSEGKIYRHVVTDLDLLPKINMLEVDNILWMIGVPMPAPAYAFANIDES